MNSAKLTNTAKLLNRSLGLRAQAARNISLTPQNNRLFGRSQAPYDDTFFGLASNLMRSLEREFDFARRQLDRTVGQVLPQTYLPSIFSRFSRDESDIIKVDQEGNRKLQLSFDLSEFDPEDIKVKTHGHNLKITAKREKKTDTDYYLKEFSQSYSLPKELKLEDLHSKWSEDGVLTIEAVLPKQIESAKTKSKEREIPIEHGSGQETKNITEGADAAGKAAAGLGADTSSSTTTTKEKK